MNEKRMIHWLAAICLAAGISRMGMTPSSLIWGTDSPQELAFGFIASILMSVGTIATFMVQSRETGRIGFITALAIIIGNIVTACMLWTTIASANPAASPEGITFTIMHMVMMIGFTGGTLVFAILTFRAKVFPRWVVVLQVLMMVSMVLPIEDNKYFAFFWGLTYVGMGYAIMAGKLNASKEVAKA